MFDQSFLGADYHIGPRPFYHTGNNGLMTRGPVQLAKELTGLTGEKLAEKMQISPAHLSRLARNRRTINSKHIEKLAEICGRTPEEFYRLLGTAPGDVEEAASMLTGRPHDEPLLIDPKIFKKAYDRAREIEKAMLGGRGSNEDFALILDQAYQDLLHDDAEG